MIVNFAVITDIHGNAPALQAVLRKIDATLEIDHIFCLGDMIGIGPDTNEVLDMLFSREDISMVTGNHDEAVLALVQGQEHPRSHFHVKEHHQWIADRIDPFFASKLAELPRTIRKRMDGYSILFTHYRINESKAQAPISDDPFDPILEPSLENMENLFAGSLEDLICFGHHHPRHFFNNGRTIYLNPGALGCNSTPTAPYAIVRVGEQGIDIAIEEAAYDNKKFLLSYEKLKVPERKFILEIFHGNQLGESF